MLEMNKVMLIGNLTRDPEVSQPGSTTIAKLGLAVNRRFQGKDGQNKDETTFVDIDVWAKTAEFCGQYLKKGNRVYVEGRLNFSSWQDQAGVKRSKLNVVAERVQFALPKPPAHDQGGTPPPATAGPPMVTEDTISDDLPF